MKEELRETINEIAKELEKLKEGETFRFEVIITKSDVNSNNEAVKVKIEETEDFEKRVSKILVRLGFPSNIKGYYYIKKASISTCFCSYLA